VRKIKSHKGGRTEIIPPCRVTPEEKSLVDEARKSLSYSDFIVQSAKKKVNHSSRQKAK
jgi:hypothetical protein